VRHYQGRYRHITLAIVAMVALAYLAIGRSQLPGTLRKGAFWVSLQRTASCARLRC